MCGLLEPVVAAEIAPELMGSVAAAAGGSAVDLALLSTLPEASVGLLGNAAALGDPLSLALAPTGQSAVHGASLLSGLGKLTPMDALKLNGLLGNFNQQQPQAAGGGGHRPQQVQQPQFNTGVNDQRRRRPGLSDFLQGF